MNTIVIFGASDPEQVAAEQICRDHYIAFCYAAVAGVRCHAGNAYLADGLLTTGGAKEVRVRPPAKDYFDGESLDRVILFEAGAGAIAGLRGPSGTAEVSRLSGDVASFHLAEEVGGADYFTAKVVICDHHNPGDPGYDCSPADYWRGSALGQFLAAINRDWDIDAGWRLVAASDHCPADAYAGRCPGITPEQFREYRLGQRLAWYQANPGAWAAAGYEGQPSVKKINKRIGLTIEILIVSPIDGGCADLRGRGVIPELPEAALRAGLAYIADAPSVAPGTHKVVLGGHTIPEIVSKFIAVANAGKFGTPVSAAYGNPTRGYAGVVIYAA